MGSKLASINCSRFFRPSENSRRIMHENITDLSTYLKSTDLCDEACLQTNTEIFPISTADKC